MKLQIVGELISTALGAAVPCPRVLIDALYRSDSRSRWLLKDRRQPYVLAGLTRKGFVQTDLAAHASELAADVWKTHATGESTKSIRLYDWARIALPWIVNGGFKHRILVRRNRNNHEERTYYLVFSRGGTALSEFAGAADFRWTIEEGFPRAKEELGRGPLVVQVALTGLHQRGDGVWLCV